MRLPIWTASLLVALAVPAPGRAQGGESVLTPPQVFALAEEYRHQGRIADAESLLQALARDANPDYRAEARFRLGELRMARKDYAGAADAFSALLEEKPNAQPARLELARALALLGKSGAAERQLRRAQAGGLPEDIQRLVDRFGDVLRRSRPYGASIQIGLAPDSNINQATDARTLDIGGFPLTLDQSGRATSGVGLLATGEAFASLPLEPGKSFVANLAGVGNVYRKGRFNDLYLSASAGPELALGRAVVRVAANYAWRQVGRTRYSQGYGGSIHLLCPAGKAGQFGLTLSLADQHYRIAEQDGLQSAALASYERALTPRLYGRIEANLARTEAKAAPYANTSYGFGASLSRDAGAATIYGRASYQRTDGDAPFALFGSARHDDRIDLTLGAGWKHLTVAGLTPVVRLNQTFNRSPIEIYRFKRTRLELALGERF
jgi:tetratricopeptide (TPR) repeat protein